MARMTAKLFSPKPLDARKAKTYWTPLEDPTDKDEIDKQRRLGVIIWNDIWGTEPAAIDIEFLQKHSLLTDIEDGNKSSFGKHWRYISTGHSKYTCALTKYWATMGETLKDLEIEDDDDTSTDLEIKNGLRAKLKWFSNIHPSEVFPIVPLISYSLVNSLGELFLQVDRALGEVRYSSLSRLRDVVYSRPVTTIDERSPLAQLICECTATTHRCPRGLFTFHLYVARGRDIVTYFVWFEIPR
jgi:hypothetical protein